MGDEDVAGDLADVLEEAEVEVLVLEPGQLQVAVHEGAVGVPVSQVPGHQGSICCGMWKKNRRFGRKKDEKNNNFGHVNGPI